MHQLMMERPAVQNCWQRRTEASKGKERTKEGRKKETAGKERKEGSEEGGVKVHAAQRKRHDEGLCLFASARFLLSTFL